MNARLFSVAPKNGRLWLWDMLFLISAAAYAFLSLEGITQISANGALLDSDLETYAQGMAGELRPDLFAADPVLRQISPANSIPNIQRLLGAWLMPANTPGVGLLRAGAIAIFIFYAGWYALGRRLFQSPSVAAILALVCGITIWIGWGTFWGVTHSDPVPRVFFAAIFPFLLILAMAGAVHLWLRPLACFACGLCMWVHGISALNCGAMFLMAFLLLKPANSSIKKHIFNTLTCVSAFLGPVLLFLWPSLIQRGAFSPEEIAIFSDVFALRWHEDYASFSEGIKFFLNPSQAPILICIGGVAGWALLKFRGNAREKTFCALCPGFFLALGIMTLFCWAESEYSPRFGRLPMGHEFVRGLRFLVPISLILVIGACNLFCGKWIRRCVLCIILIALSLFTVDRQYVAAQYAIAQKTGLPLPLLEDAKKRMKKAESYRQLYEAIEKIVPPGEAIFSAEDEMGIRFVAWRPLIHTFKDGYVYYYNKDFPGSASWLDYEKKLRQKPDGYLEAWQKSGAPWLLIRKDNETPNLKNYGHVALEQNGWLLVGKNSGHGG